MPEREENNFLSSVLIIDDDVDVCRLFHSEFAKNSFFVDEACCLKEALKKLSEYNYDAVLVDVYLGDEDGLIGLTEMIKCSPLSKFFSITAHDTVPLAVKAMELGASGFFPKSFSHQQIVSIVKSKLEIADSETEDFSQEFEKYNFIGRCEKMQKLFSQIKQFSDVDSTVIIRGESGTGKEVVAKTLHKISKKKKWTI